MVDMSVTETRDHLGDILGRVQYGGQRIKITRHGRSAAVLMPVEDAELLERLEDRMDLLAVQKAKQEEGEVPLAALKEDSGS